MRYILRDINNEMTDAWTTVFRNVPDVEIGCGDIFEKKADAIVSPANSFGFMDGGIDAVYTGYFGQQLQDRLQALIQRDHYGMLPVGQAVVIPTENKGIPYLISAPTMTVPMDICGTINAYLAFRAAIIAAQKHNESLLDGSDAEGTQIETILCPGLGTMVGKMPAMVAAYQMLLAYRTCEMGRVFNFPTLAAAWSFHEELRRALQ